MCRASDSDSVYIKPSAVSAEFNFETNTLKITNDYYNPLQTEKYYRSWLTLDAIYKSDGYPAGNIKEWALNLSNVPDDLKNKIFLSPKSSECWIWFEQSANILEWDK